MVTKHLNLRISDQYILETKQVKYLGLTINEHLSWHLYFSFIQLKKTSIIVGSDVMQK